MKEKIIEGISFKKKYLHRMETANKKSAIDKTKEWLESVANGDYTMSQRKVLSLYKKGMNLEDIIKQAKTYKIHLLLLKDDKGEELIAASKDEFTVLC